MAVKQFFNIKKLHPQFSHVIDDRQRNSSRLWVAKKIPFESSGGSRDPNNDNIHSNFK